MEITAGTRSAGRMAGAESVAGAESAERAPTATAAVRRVPPSEPPWELDAPPSPAVLPRAETPVPALPAGLPGRAAIAASSARSPARRDARRDEAAARRVLTLVLEVVDGRRPPGTVATLLDRAARLHVGRLAAEAAVDHRRAAAVLRTVTVAATPVGSQGAAAGTGLGAGLGAGAGAAAPPWPARLEVCATYARGRRLFAMAARIEIGAGGALRCSGLRMPA